jgi:hypothetical protein
MTPYEIRPPKRTDPEARQPSTTVPVRAVVSALSQCQEPATAEPSGTHYEHVAEAYDEARNVALAALETVRRPIHAGNALTVALAGGLL